MFFKGFQGICFLDNNKQFPITVCCITTELGICRELRAALWRTTESLCSVTKLSSLEFLLLTCKQPQKKQAACVADFWPSAAQLPFHAY